MFVDDQNFHHTRDWSPKFETRLNIIIGIVQKAQEWPSCPWWYHFGKMTAWSFLCKLFLTMPIMIFSPVSNFGDQSLALLLHNILKEI